MNAGTVGAPGTTVISGTAKASGSTAAERREEGPVLVAGIGLSWLDHLHFALQLVPATGGPDGPDNLEVEDLTLAAHHALNRVLEIGPSQVVLVAVVSRGHPPGTVHRSILDLTPPLPETVHLSLVESVTLDIVDLDHILTVLRHWKVLPERTVLIEIEPGAPAGRGAEQIEDDVLALVQQSW